jgi:hypothetical protein
MKHSEPLFISSADMDRHCEAAKELRSRYLRDIAEGIRRKIMPQNQSARFCSSRTTSGPKRDSLRKLAPAAARGPSRLPQVSGL